MKKILILTGIILLLQHMILLSDAGHGEDVPHTPAGTQNTFSAEALSQNFEVVLKYSSLSPDRVSVMRLYVADFYSNAPVNNASVVISPIGTPSNGISFGSVTPSSPGVYSFTAKFPEKKTYSLLITISSGSISEAVMMSVDLAKQIPAVQQPAEEGLSTLVIILISAAVAFLTVIWYYLHKKKIKTTQAATIQKHDNARPLLTIVFIISAGVLVYAIRLHAHGGEDHGEPSTTPPAAGSTIGMPKETQFLLGIRTAMSDRGIVNKGLQTSGVLIPTTQGIATVTAPQPGKITQISNLPSVGSYVQKGQILAVLEQTLSASERLAVINETTRLRSELTLAQKELDRVRQLRRYISQKELEIAEQQVITARTSLESYQKVYSGTGVTRFDITAPISGVITKAEITRGEQVEPSSELFEIVDVSRLWVDAKISEQDLARIQRTRSATFIVTAFPDEVFYGSLFTIGKVIDEQTRTTQALFEVRNRANMLKVGMLATVSIDIGEKIAGILVPKDAVVNISGKTSVFVHTKAEEFQAKVVSVGSSDNSMIEIISGLAEDERVVTSGVYQLKLAANGI